MGVTLGAAAARRDGARRQAWAKTRRQDPPRVHRNRPWRRRQHVSGRSRTCGRPRVGRAFDLTPSSLSPLEPWRDWLTIVSNTDVRRAEALPAPKSAPIISGRRVFLTQAHPRQTQGSDVQVGISLDQYYAKRFGQDTPIPSMQLCIENIDQAGGCSYGYACVYTDTISWASPTEPLPMVRDPRVAFDQLFGAGATKEERAARRLEDRSILDVVTAALAGLKRISARATRGSPTIWTTSARSSGASSGSRPTTPAAKPRELPEAPVGVPDSFDEHVKLMFDLQALAFASEITRVFSFKLGRDSSSRVYPGSGSRAGFHNASHHGDREELILDFAKINRYHVESDSVFPREAEEHA